jgi:hypothetical protein
MNTVHVTADPVSVSTEQMTKRVTKDGAGHLEVGPDLYTLLFPDHMQNTDIHWAQPGDTLVVFMPKRMAEYTGKMIGSEPTDDGVAVKMELTGYRYWREVSAATHEQETHCFHCCKPLGHDCLTYEATILHPYSPVQGGRPPHHRKFCSSRCLARWLHEEAHRLWEPSDEEL